MKTNRKVFHAGDFQNLYGLLPQGLSGTSFCSGIFYTLSKEECEYQGAGFNREHIRPVYSFQLTGLNLFPTSARDCRTLNLFNKALYYFPVWLSYAGGIDYMIYYKPLYKALQKCFEEYYADDVPEDERSSKFYRELEDSYKIEANDVAEIDGEHYTLQDYIADTPCLRELQKCVRRIEPDAHNTMPYLTKLMLNSNSFEEFEDTMLNESTVYSTTHLYHISKKPESDKIKTGGIWVASDFGYIEYIQQENNRQYIYDVYPKKELNIFDTRDPSTLEEVRQYVKDNNIEFDPNEVCQEDISEFGIEDWDSYFNLIRQFVDWQIAESPFMVKAAKDLGYDGYVSVEDGFENYYIFDRSKLDIVLNKKLSESKKLRENEEQDRLLDELDNFLDKFELATNIDNMLQKVADLVDISKEDITKEAYKIYSKYADLYDKVTGRFDNWSAPKDNLFATQLLKDLGYDGTYPLEDADNTEWGGVVFDLESIKAINPENDEAKKQISESIRRYRNLKEAEKLEEGKKLKALALALLVGLGGVSTATAKSKVAKLTPEQTFETIKQELPSDFSKEDWTKVLDAYMETDEATGDRMTDSYDLRNQLNKIGKTQTGSYKSIGGGWYFSD